MTHPQTQAQQLEADFEIHWMLEVQELTGQRIRSNLSQGDMARRIGVSLKSIQRFENYRSRSALIRYGYNTMIPRRIKGIKFKPQGYNYEIYSLPLHQQTNKAMIKTDYWGIVSDYEHEDDHLETPEPEPVVRFTYRNLQLLEWEDLKGPTTYYWEESKSAQLCSPMFESYERAMEELFRGRLNEHVIRTYTKTNDNETTLQTVPNPAGDRDADERQD